MDDYNVTVDNNFLANALTVVMQMQGTIEEDEYVVVYDIAIDEDTGHLKLAVDKKRATIN